MCLANRERGVQLQKQWRWYCCGLSQPTVEKDSIAAAKAKLRALQIEDRAQLQRRRAEERENELAFESTLLEGVRQEYVTTGFCSCNRQA